MRYNRHTNFQIVVATVALLLSLGWGIGGALITRHSLGEPASMVIDSNGDFTPITFDFGRVAGGTKVQHTYVLLNPLQQTLNIQRIAVACRCTLVSQAPKTIAPGKAEDLKLQLDVGPDGGRISRSLIVEFLGHTPLKLNIEGEVIQVSPTELVFDNVLRGKSDERCAIIRSVSGRTILFQYVKYDKDLFTVHVTNGTNEYPDGRLIIDLNKDMPLGGFASALTFATNDKGDKYPTIMVRGNVLHPIEPRYKTLAFGIVGAGQKSAQEIAIYSPYGYPFSITSLAVPPESAPFVETGSWHDVNGDVKIPVIVHGGFLKKVLADDITITAQVNGKPERTQINFFAMSQTPVPETQP